MIYAQIQGNKVANIIVLDDPTLAHVFKEGFEDIVNITDVDPQPAIGANYIDGVFS